MSINNDIVKQSIMGNGSTLVFNYTVPYIDASTLYVYLKKISTGVTVELIKGTDYTILLTPPNLETVTIVINPGISKFTAPPSADDQIWLIRSTIIVQTYYDLNANSPWVPVQTEEAFDRLTLQLQEIEERLSRAITSPPTGGSGSATLPAPEANKYLKWNAAATALINSPYDVDGYDARMNANAAAITTLQNQLLLVNNQINAIGTEIGNLQIDIADLEAANVAQDQILGDHGSRIVTLELLIGSVSDQSAAILDLQNRMTVVEAEILDLQTELALTISRVEDLEDRVTNIEITNRTFRRTGRFMLVQPSYVTDTALPGLIFDFDFTSSSLLYLELRRTSSTGDFVEIYTYSAVWANGEWNLTVTQSDMPTALTGINILMVQDLIDKATSLYFNAPSTIPGTYDPLTSWIAWTIEDKVRI